MTAASLVAALLVGCAVLVWPPVRRDGDGGADGDGRSRVEVGGDGLGPRVASRAASRAPVQRVPGANVVSGLRHRLCGRRDGGPTTGVEEVQVLDGLAAALEAGLPTERAVQVAVAPVVAQREAAAAWSELERSAREGQPLGPAWQRVARRTGSLTAASVARAWTVASTTGAPLASAVRASAHAARERHRLERAVEVATAGARATARVLGLLPVLGVGLAGVLGIGPVTLYSHPLALASAGLGLVLLLTGHLLVRRMVRGVLGGVA